MIKLLSEYQKDMYRQFNEFCEEKVAPFSSEWEKNEKVSDEIIKQCIQSGYFGGTIPQEFNGNGWDACTFGAFTETLARTNTSLSGMFNVHNMVMRTIYKWGNENQKNKWLSKMCKGQLIGAFALTEPDAGSDIKNVKTIIEERDNDLLINGKKKWITFGCLADVILVFGRFGKVEGPPVACLVEKNTPGMVIKHINGMLGFKASQLAEIEFNDCIVKKENLISRPGLAFSNIAPYALDYGRISVAFTALGILKGCLDYCSVYALKRKTFNERLIDRSTIREMITKMAVDYEAACHLCISACKAKDNNDLDANEKIMIAKYFVTKAARRHTDNAVQIIGALGCNENHPVSRYYRDSKILEIIEGSNQIHEMILGPSFARKYGKENY